MSHQRELAIAILTYIQDTGNECLPFPQNWINATKLVNDAHVWSCPSSNNKGTSSHPNYGYNAHLYTRYDKKPDIVMALYLGDIANPEQIELTCDIGSPLVLSPDTNDPGLLMQKGAYTVSAFNKESVCRHAGGIVVSYLDGHVAFLKQSEIGRGKNRYNIPAAFTK